MQVGFLLLGALSALSSVSAKYLTFYGSAQSPKVDANTPSTNDWIATAEFTSADDHNSNFAQLKIRTNSDFPDDLQLFAAGYVEGILTAKSIYQHYNNMLCQVDCTGYVSPEVQEFFTAQDMWARDQVATHQSCDYWTYIGSVLNQADGLVAGYGASEFASESAEHKLPLWAFTMLNAMGDLFDIIPATSPSKRPDFQKMSYHESVTYFRRSGHCSAFVKLTDDMSDIYMGHNAWFTYCAMLRIYKTYSFPLSNAKSATDTIAFSSYPAMLSSLDDFYMMKDSKLVMLQTTNSIYNASLWDLVKPESLLAWQRIRAANKLSLTGPQWYDIVSKHNSGTYNNQYMIIDGKLFRPGNALQPESLFIVEQIPGHVAGSDATDILAKGYWGSFNVPFHKDIYVESGYGSVDEKAGHQLYTEYDMAPRAQIFRREQGSVSDMSSMQRVMQFNEFQTDPLAGGSPWGAIAARGDLDESSPYAGGGYDTKITTWSRLVASSPSLEANIVNGPTHQDQKPFSWTGSGLGDSNVHMGQPDVFEFEFELVNSDFDQ